MTNKLICIKDSKGVSLSHLSVTKGEFYLCNESKRYIDCYEVNVPDNDDNKDILYIGLFYKSNFLSQAEWRDKQINSILDEL